MKTDTDSAGPKVATSRLDGATRDEILRSAATLIASEGYPACTMRSISEKIQMKAGSLYHHFGSKDEILLEIMNVGVRMILEEVARQVSSMPPSSRFEDRLRVAIRAHAACMVDQSMPFIRVYEHLPPIIKRQARVTRKEYSDFWVAFLESGKEAGEVDQNLNLAIFVPFLLSGLNRISDWYRDHMNVNEVADLVTDMCLGGIRERVLARA
jgi:AcrR family transcriptional regulator